MILIINQWVIAERADELKGLGETRRRSRWHKSFGMTILMLAVIRLVWRWMNPVPGPHRRDQALGTRAREGFARAAVRADLRHAAHRLDDVVGAQFSGELVQAVPVPGPRGAGRRRPFTSMHDLHHLLFNVLVGVALLHVAGALKHHFIDRNDVLKRMLPFGGVK